MTDLTVVGTRRYAFFLAVAALLAVAVSLADTPAPAQGSASATFEVTCAPDPFPPDEWVVIDCQTIITSNSDDLVEGGQLSVVTASGPIPEYLWVSLTVDGKQVMVLPGSLTFPVPPLEAGQSSKSELIGLLRMSEGTWQGDDSLYAGDKQLSVRRVDLTALGDAPALPADLNVTTKLIGGGELSPSATFETVIKNTSSNPATLLRVTEESEGAEVTSSEPESSPKLQEGDVTNYSWDLSSFGKDTLGPGESLTLDLKYASPFNYPCSSVYGALIVQADTGDGIKRYGLPTTEQGFMVGDCRFEGGEAAGETPLAFGRGGEGPAGASSNPMWAAELLAMAGGGLVTTSMLLRRQSR